MAMQKVQTEAPKSDITFVKLGEGESFIGYYLYTEEFIKDGDDLTRCVFIKGGEKFSILANKVLLDRMNKVPKGTLTEVTFVGWVTGKGPKGRRYKNWEVGADADDVLSEQAS